MESVKAFIEHSWLREPAQQAIQGKRVLVVENDIATGKTLSTIHACLKDMQPTTLDVAFTDSPTISPTMARSLKNLPAGYGRAFTTDMLDPVYIGAACKAAKRLLQN